MQKKELQPLPNVSPTSFIFSNSKWSNMANKTPNLNSINIAYFLSCNSCEGTTNNTSYILQTTNLRNRMNNHISECRTGKSSCYFPKHVFECGRQIIHLKNPFSKSLFSCLLQILNFYCTMEAVAYPRGGMGGPDPPTFQNVGLRDSHENVIKLVGGEGRADLSRSGL